MVSANFGIDGARDVHYVSTETKKEHAMSKAPLIVDELTRITERADIFRHARDEFFQGISLAEMHCMHWIGLTGQPNVTKIAERMRMTRGAISKIVKKLIGKELVESYQILKNKKEIYFRLTDNGRRLFDEHLQCHTRARREKIALLQEFTMAEQDCILRFLNAINVQIDAKMAETCAPCAMDCPASRAEGDQ